MPTRLSEAELRVLGVMIEKSLAHPASYPLTANAITQGCNQKQNRDPIVAYTEAEVLHTLRRLEAKGLSRQASPAPGARVYRFEHCVVEQFHWDRREQAVMAELILRGRQTAGELRARASRMTAFDDLPAVGATLHALMGHDPPFAEELPREPGRPANRFRHLLSAEERSIEPPAAETQPAGSVQASDDTTASLRERVAKLEAQVANLTRIVDELRKKENAPVDDEDDENL